MAFWKWFFRVEATAAFWLALFPGSLAGVGALIAGFLGASWKAIVPLCVLTACFLFPYGAWRFFGQGAHPPDKDEKDKDASAGPKPSVVMTEDGLSITLRRRIEVGETLVVRRPKFDSMVKGITVRLSDYVTHTNPVIEGVTFERCTILGPAVLLLDKGTTLTGESDIHGGEDAFWSILKVQKAVIGAIIVRCVFVSCKFRAIGFVGERTERDKWVKQLLKTP